MTGPRGGRSLDPLYGVLDDAADAAEPDMDFTIPDDLIELKERTERFVRDEIMPRESDRRQTHHGPTEEFRHELVALARAAGLVSPHVGREWGGLAPRSWNT